MNDITIPDDTIDFLRAVASQSRLNILLQFVDGREWTVNEVAAAVALGQSTTSEHLAQLKRAGLMTARKEGKEVFYQPDRDQILGHLATLENFLTRCCPV